MAINETISTGNKYRRLKDATNKVWQRLSFWTKASDVEFDNGYTAQATLGNITGITDSVNSSASNVAASANAVYQLNSNINALSTQNSRINLYVGGDGKLHFVNKDGADSALNFSSYTTETKTWSWSANGDGSNYGGTGYITLQYSGTIIGIAATSVSSFTKELRNVFFQPVYGTPTFPYSFSGNVLYGGWNSYQDMPAGSISITAIIVK